MAIALHIAEHSPPRARSVVARLKSRTEILRSHPLAGRLRPELGEGMRSLSERPYVLIYRVVGEGVDIVAVLHGARDLPATLAARLGREAP